MAITTKFPFELIKRFHKFRLNALPMPLPEGELLTLAMVWDLNQEVGVQNTLISVLAEQQHVSVPTTSRCLGKLEEKGLIQKMISEDDRRSTCVSLTEKGERVVSEAKKTLSSFIQKALSRIDEEELNQFYLTFDKIYEALALEYEALRPTEKPQKK